MKRKNAKLAHETNSIDGGLLKKTSQIGNTPHIQTSHLQLTMTQFTRPIVLITLFCLVINVCVLNQKVDIYDERPL